METTDARVHRALARIQAGDSAAKNDLLAYASDQLERMARKMMRGSDSYEVVRRWEQTDDVLQGAYLRLSRTIDAIEIATPRDFFKLAATNIRWELKTLRDKHNAKKADARWYQSDVKHGSEGQTLVPAGIVDGAEAPPDVFAAFSRFLDEIENIPAEDREMIDLVIVDGLTQQEAADTLGMSLSTFRRRYREACVRLGSILDRMDSR